MKRLSLMFTALAFGLLAGAESANAQALTMQMSNGWTFSFSGNVNAFLVYESQSDNPGGITDPEGVGIVGDAELQGSSIRTGLLPTFAVFEAWGREGNTDLKVHFGFAPQIQTPGGHDNFNTTGDDTQAGAQIDMRQVYLTVGGEWGQILAGREIGVYQRQNILNDQTLFGTGATGGNFGNAGGTTLGRIGFGYVYPNFNAQITYSSRAGRPAQFTLGLFDPSTNNDFDEVTLPRFEGEFVYTAQSLTFWLGGLAQNQKDTGTDESEMALGVSGGVKYSAAQFSLVGSGYYGKGIGTTLMFLAGQSSESTELRPSYGFIGQGTFTPTGSKVTFGASYGQSTLQNADDEDVTNPFEVTNASITAGVYYQATNSLKVVGEGTYAWSTDDDDATDENKTVAISGGLMLFF